MASSGLAVLCMRSDYPGQEDLDQPIATALDYEVDHGLSTVDGAVSTCRNEMCTD